MLANKMNVYSSGKFNLMERRPKLRPNTSHDTQFTQFYSQHENVLLVTWCALRINHFHMRINCHYILLHRCVHFPIRSAVVNRSWILNSMFRCHRRFNTKPINIFRMSYSFNINHFQIMRTHIHSVREHK